MYGIFLPYTSEPTLYSLKDINHSLKVNIATCQFYQKVILIERIATMSIIYPTDSICSGFIPHGATASSIFGASSEASERPYNLNEPTSPSLLNFLGRGRARDGSLRDLYDRTASIAMVGICLKSVHFCKTFCRTILWLRG